jgi:hypothetical protein
LKKRGKIATEGTLTCRCRFLPDIQPLQCGQVFSPNNPVLRVKAPNEPTELSVDFPFRKGASMTTSTPRTHTVTICVFALTVICILGALALAFFGPEKLTETQGKVFDMLNFG